MTSKKTGKYDPNALRPERRQTPPPAAPPTKRPPVATPPGPNRTEAK